MTMAGRTVAVIGGDRRMPSAAEALAAHGLWVRAVGLAEEPKATSVVRCSDMGEALAGAHVILLPVQPLGPERRIHTEYPVPALHLKPADLDRAAPACTLFAGVATSEVRADVMQRGHRLVEYRDRDAFALYNSVPSAEGAMAMAMAASPLTLFGNRSLVLGFGRTGATLAGMLRGIGGRVTVAARKETDLARAYAFGHEGMFSSNLVAAAASADFIFNTVPELILTRTVLEHMPRQAVIVDLASAPGGTDFIAAEALGLTALLAPGLPGKTAPVSAGRIVAEMVIRYLQSASDESAPGEGAVRRG